MEFWHPTYITGVTMVTLGRTLYQIYGLTKCHCSRAPPPKDRYEFDYESVGCKTAPKGEITQLTNHGRFIAFKA